MAIIPRHLSADGAARLRALSFASVRAMELCCAWLTSVPETRVKIQLGKAAWYLACAADTLLRRAGEMDAPHLERAKGPECSPAYVSCTNAFMALSRTEARLFALHELALKDLSNALGEHAAASRSICDQPTVDALFAADGLVRAQIEWYRSARDVSARESARALLGRELVERWGAAGGVLSRGDEGAASVEPMVASLDALPAREERLTVTTKFPPFPSGTRFGEPLVLHTTAFVIEICAAEICARNIVDHRESPWAFKMDMARQTWDEVRHAEALLDRCEELGGHIGMYPIDLSVWRAYALGETLPEKLILEQRLGEGRGLDAGFLVFMRCVRDEDETTARIFDYLSVDEINHVKNGNRWIRHFLADDQEAIDALEKRAYEKIHAAELAWVPPPIWRAGRKAADFTDEELRAHTAYREQVIDRAKRTSPG